MVLASAKKLLSSILLLSLSSKLCALTFTTKGCGETKGCYASPASCTNSENCDFLVTYNATNSTHVEFELSGKGDWIAVGFSDDQFMVNTDILMCVNNQSLSGHYYATNQSRPPRTNPTPAAVQFLEEADENNTIKCRVSRDINPDPPIQNFKDLNQEVFLLAAYGNVTGSGIQQHSNREASPQKVVVTQANSTIIPQVNTNTSAPAMQQGSFRFPDNCPDADCHFLVTYQASGNNSVVFELRGRGNWAGVGFSDDNQMPDTDILICASDTLLSGHYYATSRTTPNRTDPNPSAVEITNQSFNGSVVSCRITRELDPGIANFRNLRQDWFLLGAIGDLNGATIVTHSDRRASSSRINVVTGEVGSGGTVMPTSSSSTEAPTMQQGSFRFPDNCPDADCDFLVTYQASSDDNEKVVFELRGRGNWAGVGFSEDNQMPDTDILICASDTLLSGHYYATGRIPPTRTNPTPSAVEITNQLFNGGVVSCRITREVNPGLTNFRNLAEQQFLLGAIGSLSGATIGFHSDRRASASRIDVRSGADAAGNSAIEAMVLAHGILMTLAWLLFAFVGLFTARYMRQVWEPTKLLREKAWFTVHRTLMIITLLLTITGTIVIFVFIDGWSSNAGPHPFLGIVTIALALIQPIMAAFRPHPGEPKREIFNWCHRIVGIGALVMAIVTIDYGLATEKVGLGKEGFRAIIAFIIGIGLIIMFELYLFITKINKEKRTVSSNNSRDIQMEPTGQQTAQPHPKMSIKEAMLRSLMFTFVVLLGAAVALTIILLMVLK